MDEAQMFRSLGIAAEDIFRDAMLNEYFGGYLFDTVERDHYLFSSHETGDAVWLVESGPKEGEHQILYAEQTRKFHPNPLVPRICSFSYCVPIDKTWLEDRRIEDIKRQVQQGGKTLGSKINRAYIHVLTKALLEESKIPVQQSLDELLADVSSKMVRDGFRPSRFVFPQHLEGKLVQQKIVIRDTEIRNSHYVGKTISGQDAFWADEMPDDIAFVFDSTVGITLNGKPKFYIAPIGPLLPGVCGDVRLNPIIRNRKSVIALIGIEQVLDNKGAKVTMPAKAQITETYVDPKRIAELKAIAPTQFDLTRLIEYCAELNKCYADECYLAVAMLTRAILDHVPPIFKFESFTEVANNYGGSGDRSLKGSLQHLDNVVRKIADFYLHRQIRNKETLPNKTQVDFRNTLDMLLAEIVRILK